MNGTLFGTVIKQQDSADRRPLNKQCPALVYKTSNMGYIEFGIW